VANVSAYLRLIARLKDGMTHESAQARLDQITASNVAAAIFSRPHSLPYIFRTRRTEGEGRA
jgi:hypothetical protein